jgi:putative methionine-R-sulfoxide reductase with GAF domain
VDLRGQFHQTVLSRKPHRAPQLTTLTAPVTLDPDSALQLLSSGTTRLKSYKSARLLLAEVEKLLSANSPSFHHSPLTDVIELLCSGRHYSWMGVYLTASNSSAQQLLDAGGDPHPSEMAHPETRSKVLVSMKLAGRELGILDVESTCESAFGIEDRVLLENVANRLGRFLAGRGQYIVRKARSAASTGRSKPAAAKRK